MKLTILNVLLLVIIVALVYALIAERRKVRSITVDFEHPYSQWELVAPELDSDCYWVDQTKPPPTDIHRAFEIADEIRSRLDECSEQSNLDNWQLAAVTLTSLDPVRFITGNASLWCYIVRFESLSVPMHAGSPHVFFCMILMDETVIVGKNGSGDTLETKMKNHYPDPDLDFPYPDFNQSD